MGSEMCIRDSFDSQDRVIIAWTSREGGKPGTKLVVVRQTAGEWRTIFEESADNDNSGPSLAVDADDRVHMSWRRIVFGTPNQREVWYTVERAGVEWDTQVATESQSVMWGTVLTLTSDREGLILYIDWASDTGEYRVWVARQVGQQWQQDYLSSYPENLFHHGSLALGPDDLTVVTFTRYLQDDPFVAEGLWAWYCDGTWNISALPIPDAYGSKVMFHPEGYPVLRSSMRLASYW